MAHALELFKIDNKVAVVTGGGRGLGRFMAEGLAEAGADLVITGRDTAGTLESTAEAIRSIGHDCIAVKCDITKEADVIALAAKVKEHYGRCDILVNNAGIGGMGPTAQTTMEVWNDMLQTNLTGAFLCCRELGKLMIEQKSGSIINLSSMNGQVGFSAGMAPYATTKIGVIGLTRSLAVEWGPHNIRVNALLPGNIAEGMMEFMKDTEGDIYKAIAPALTGITPLGCFGNGDDMKGAVVYLASNAARFVTGASLLVDGGLVHKGM